MRNTDHPVLHLAHPRPVAWSTLFSAVAQELGDLPLVPYREWVDRLAQSAGSSVQQVANSPALRLLDFFQAARAYAFAGSDSGLQVGAKEGREAMGLRRLALDRACHASATLSRLKDTPLDGQNAKSWIEYWEAVGFF